MLVSEQLSAPGQPLEPASVVGLALESPSGPGSELPLDEGSVWERGITTRSRIRDHPRSGTYQATSASPRQGAQVDRLAECDRCVRISRTRNADRPERTDGLKRDRMPLRWRADASLAWPRGDGRRLEGDGLLLPQVPARLPAQPRQGPTAARAAGVSPTGRAEPPAPRAIDRGPAAPSRRPRTARCRETVAPSAQSSSQPTSLPTAHRGHAARTT